MADTRVRCMPRMINLLSLPYCDSDSPQPLLQSKPGEFLGFEEGAGSSPQPGASPQPDAVGSYDNLVPNTVDGIDAGEEATYDMASGGATSDGAGEGSTKSASDESAQKGQTNGINNTTVNTLHYLV